MSLIYGSKAPEALRLPNVIDFSQKQVAIMDVGCQNFLPSVLPANSLSNSSVQFNIIPNDFQSILSRRFLLRFKFRVNITSADRGQKISESFRTGIASLQSYPINRIISNTTLSLNNIGAFNNQNSRLIPAFQHINSMQELINGPLSMSPCQPDTAYDFSVSAKSTINPMNSYQSSTYHDFGRGAFAYENVVLDSNTQFQAEFVCSEYVYCPLLLSNKELAGLVYNTNIVLQMQLDNLQNILSYDTTQLGVWSSAAVSLVSADLLYNSYTNYELQKMPENIHYPYLKLSNVNQSTIGTVAGSATFTAQSNTYQLQGVPTKIVVWAQRSESTRDYTMTDSFANISQCSITFGNKSGIMSGASEQQLFAIAKDNGLDMSWPQFHSYLGSILVFDVPTNISLESSVCPGVANWTGQFNVQITGKNLSPSAVNFNLNVVFVYDSVMTVSPSNAQIQDNLFTREDVLTSQSLPRIPKDEQRGLVGFGFLSKANEFLKTYKPISKVLDIVKSVPNPYVSGVASVGSEISKSLGYGKGAKGTKKMGKGIIGGMAY